MRERKQSETRIICNSIISIIVCINLTTVRPSHYLKHAKLASVSRGATFFTVDDSDGDSELFYLFWNAAEQEHKKSFTQVQNVQ